MLITALEVVGLLLIGAALALAPLWVAFVVAGVTFLVAAVALETRRKPKVDA